MNDWTVAQLLAFAENAEKVCEAMGEDPASAPASLGYVSMEPIPPEDLERARLFVQERGW